jgi:hypothetical protein
VGPATGAFIALFAFVIRRRDGEAGAPPPRRRDAAALFATLALLPAAHAAGTETSCTACHGSPEWFEGESLELVAHYRDDVHASAGLSCQHCHGGNPDPALADDLAAAMDPDFAPDPFRGTPERLAVPAFCGRCHSDPAFMRRFDPAARVDQEQEYRTSQHGILLAAGDAKVATCVDCHGIHGILAPDSPSSPVHPRNVAETCRRCHGDPERMADYRLPDGRPLPVDQYARWRQSVHATALLDKEDLSAPTCNDCHGNHGALPPGLGSIAFVCGQCHGREAELFRASGKRDGFERHNELLAAAEGGGCASCHAEDQPQAALAPAMIGGFSECTTCHGNHGIVRPTVAMLSPLPAVPCAFCHEGGGVAAGPWDEPEKVRLHYERTRDALLAGAAAQGLAGDERFDWLVDQALALPTHTLGSGEERRLRPEFDRLFQKFRIGKTHYTYEDPLTGTTAKAPVVRCASCHAAAPDLAESPEGLATAATFLGRMHEVTLLTARAERMLLAARRGGVEVRGPATDIDHAVDAQIELEVLVHGFSAAEDGAFAAKFGEGRGHAEAAFTGARDALRELAYRRWGLAVSLALIVLVLVALGLKIRQLAHG